MHVPRASKKIVGPLAPLYRFILFFFTFIIGTNDRLLAGGKKLRHMSAHLSAEAYLRSCYYTIQYYMNIFLLCAAVDQRNSQVDRGGWYSHHRQSNCDCQIFS